MRFVDTIVERQNKYLLALERCKASGYKTYLLGDGEGADNAQRRAGDFCFDGRLVNREYYIEKKDVFCLEDFLENTTEKVNIVVACSNPNMTPLESFSCMIESIAIYDCFSGNYAADPTLVTFDFIMRNSDKLQEIYEQLSDDYSRECLAAYINQKISMDYKYLSPLLTCPQYFEDFVELKNNEVFVDCGAYDGDSAVSFVDALKKRGITEYKKIISFEPDPNNFSRLEQRGLKNHFCYNLGVSDIRGNISFDIMGTSSGINESGAISVDVNTIDSIIHDDVTFIKMDIEGMELAALKGGSEIIKRYRPKLAICIYHKKEDLWEIQDYISSLVPEYHFYIRAYNVSTIELVLYAIIQ